MLDLFWKKTKTKQNNSADLYYFITTGTVLQTPYVLVLKCFVVISEDRKKFQLLFSYFFPYHVRIESKNQHISS